MSHYTKSIVIAVDYRLAPEHPYPAAHDDVWLAYQYVRNTAYLFGGSPNAIAVCGDSAGALLATSLCLRAKKDKIPVPFSKHFSIPCLIRRRNRKLTNSLGNVMSLHVLSCGGSSKTTFPTKR